VSEASVGKLFLGGVFPGLIIGFLMLGITLMISLWRKYPKEEVALTKREVFDRIQRAILALIMPIFVVGAVVTGIATATESAGIGALYAFVVGYFIFRGLKLKTIPTLLKTSISTSAQVMIIIALSKLYIWILVIEHIPQAVAGFVSGLHLPVFFVLLVIIAIILITGTFVDVSPAILLLTPVFLPAVTSLGVSPIQFGVILITGLAIGLVTPPVGMCLNVASAISKLGIGTIFRAAMPFSLANVITLILITLIPPISMWLPSVLME
jgi:tripartite ATP-independent transporter DctM subunit